MTDEVVDAQGSIEATIKDLLARCVRDTHWNADQLWFTWRLASEAEPAEPIAKLTSEHTGPELTITISEMVVTLRGAAAGNFLCLGKPGTAEERPDGPDA